MTTPGATEAVTPEQRAPQPNDDDIRTGQAVAMLYAAKFGPVKREALDYIAHLAAQACASTRVLTMQTAVATAKNLVVTFDGTRAATMRNAIVQALTALGDT